MKSIKNFHHYLYGKPFKVRTDHGSLTWLLNFKNPEGQIARWFEFLSSYDFQVEHRASRSHNNADALSRRPCKDCKYSNSAETKYEQRISEELIPSSCHNHITPSNVPEYRSGRASISKSPSLTKHNNDKLEHNASENKDFDLSECQNYDPDLKIVIKWLKSDIATANEVCKFYWARYNSLFLVNEVLYHKWESVVPKIQIV